MAFRHCIKLNAGGLPNCQRLPNHEGECAFDNSLDHTVIINRLSKMYRELRGTVRYMHVARGSRYSRSPLYGIDTSNGAGDEPMTLYFPHEPSQPLDKKSRPIDFFVRKTSEFDDGRFEKLGDES